MRTSTFRQVSASLAITLDALPRKNMTGTLKEVFVARKLRKTENRKTSTVNEKVDGNRGSRPSGLRIQPKPSRKPDDGKPSTKKNNG